MEFLAEYDPSLTNSLEKAAGFGFQLSDLNSEKLASLLLQDILNDALSGLHDELEAYFSTITD